MASDTTTIRVSKETRELVEVLAKTWGVSHDKAVARMARHERQRVIGASLAEREQTPSDEAVMRAGANTVNRATR